MPVVTSSKLLYYDLSKLADVVEILRQGGVICFPTDTIYAMAADAQNSQAVDKIYAIKQRPRDKPLTVFFKNNRQIILNTKVNEQAKIFMREFFPGPMTLVLPVRDEIIANISFYNKSKNDLAVRIPNHPIALSILNEFTSPLVATSVNLSGSKSVETLDKVVDLFGDKVDLIVDYELKDHDAPSRNVYGKESTIVDCTGENFAIVREGVIKSSILYNLVSSIH